MIKAVKPDKNDMLVSAMDSWLTQWLDVCFTWKSKLANQKHWRVFMNTLLHSKECEALKCWQSMLGVATDAPEASRSFVETSQLY